MDESNYAARYWHALDDGRIQCDLCPRDCKLKDGQRGHCFVRQRKGDAMVLTTYGRSSGFCVDPVEKKPLNHFLVGTSILSFGTAGCNLGCKFCFHPDTQIATADGLRRIEDLFAACDDKLAHGDGQIGFPTALTVWTRHGRAARVTKVFAHPYAGELLAVKAGCCPELRLTPNHGVFASTRANPHDVRKVRADELTPEHLLVVPKRAAGEHGFERGGPAEDERAIWRDEGSHILTPVRRITRVPYSGTVYNLEVDDPDHSYLAPFLAVSNCQNYDISKSREVDRLADQASPEMIAQAAVRAGCQSVAFTYNDPVIFAEYAMDVADACHEVGVKAVAVTAGFMHDVPRREFYAKMDAANVDLKAFTEDFYYRVTGSHLRPVLDTLTYLKHETRVWFEITTLLIPGHNDSDKELRELSAWVAKELGPDVPLHFTAFHPDYKMLDVPRTPPETLTRARGIARDAGLRYVYTGNVHDRDGGATACPGCGKNVIERDWYEILAYRLDEHGRCPECGTAIAGRFQARAGRLGRRRIPVVLSPR